MSSKVGIIIGAGAGMGMALARRFGREGYTLALVARNVEKLAAEMEALENIEAKAYSADASDEAALKATFAKIQEELGAAEVLIYNAAAVIPGEPSTLSPEVVLQHFRVNVVGALISAQQVIPQMKAQGRGTILFTGGGLSRNPNAQYSSLAMSKAALRNLTESLAQELTPHGIKVGTVTIAGYIQPGSAFDPDRIAEDYWSLHTSEPSATDFEIYFDGA